MPTQRKRIGFLPRSEVQNVIDKICKDNKLSQSKVTGILVEEALCSRGVLNSFINKTSIDFNNYKKQPLLNSDNNFNSKRLEDKDNINLNESYINDEVQMINDFIEYKLFKKIMNKNKRLLGE